jgi:hypothetical protein
MWQPCKLEKNKNNNANEIQSLIKKYKELMSIIRTDTTEKGYEARNQVAIIERKLDAMNMCVLERQGNNFSNQPIQDSTWLPCGSDPERENEICRLKGQIFETSANMRNQGVSPETVQDMQAGYLKSWTHGITKEFIKNTINLVYFDPAFINAGGPRLANQIRNICMTGSQSQFQPLK